MTPDDLKEHIARLRERRTALENEQADPVTFTNPANLRRVSGELRRLERILAHFDLWVRALSDWNGAKKLAEDESDPELRQWAESELPALQQAADAAEFAFVPLLVPPDPHDTRDAIVEIRPAAGGDEAALFAGEMFRLLCRYAEKRAWKLDVLDLSETGLGGLKEAVFSISGDDVFSRLKYESGVHRVQRVPATEAAGRIHTSTITVSVLPEAEEIDDISIRPEELEISTFRSSGPGGQNVNRTDSAVRIVHKPTGITVASQQERSQIRNREIALRILKSKLLEMRNREEAEKLADSKRRQVGSGDRSEKIRTYNFPQNRVTDHRFNVSVFHLPALMDGNLDLILDPIFEQSGKLRLNEILEDPQ